MDSKGMYGSGQPRTPKRKVYCILEKDGYIYFPIAAQYSPYFLHDGNKVESYLAGMPNFFGGNMEGAESIEAALMREIREESQGRIILNIPNKLGDPIFADPVRTALPEQNTYKFYVLKPENCTIEKFVWEDGNVIRLHSFEKKGRSKDYCAQYEDSFLVQMDKESFCGFISRLKELREVPEAVHGLLGELGINSFATKTSIGNWYGSHTFKAFAAGAMKL